MNVKRFIYRALDRETPIGQIVASLRDQSPRTSEHYIQRIAREWSREPRCPICNKPTHLYIFTTSGPDGREYHNDCWRTRFVRCDRCHSVSERSANRTVFWDGERICLSCVERYLVCCESCRTLTWRDDTREVDGRRVCYSCYEACRPIQSYSWSPSRFVFSKQAWENTTFLGVELEVESPDADADDVASRVKSLSDRIYCKHDGSLSSGFEVVTHPPTLQSMHLIGWHRILKELQRRGCTSHDNGRCGLHVHVSKSGLSERQMNNMRRFFALHKSELATLSNRRGRNTDYCRFESLSETSEAQSGRYWALNCNSSQPTLEVRIFRGTLLHWRLMADVQLVDALVEFCAFGHMRRHCWDDFAMFVESSNRYAQLMRLMRMEGLTCA